MKNFCDRSCHYYSILEIEQKTTSVREKGFGRTLLISCRLLITQETHLGEVHGSQNQGSGHGSSDANSRSREQRHLKDGQRLTMDS